MKVLDLNLALYAVNRDSPLHERAKRWLETALSDEEPVAIAWAVALGFVRLATSRRVFARPLSPDQAFGVVDGWLGRPQVRLLDPGPEHWTLLKSLLTETGTAANLTTDAHLAALAIENGATLYSTDRDFGRFQELKWVNPLEPTASDGERRGRPGRKRL